MVLVELDLSPIQWIFTTKRLVLQTASEVGFTRKLANDLNEAAGAADTALACGFDQVAISDV